MIFLDSADAVATFVADSYMSSPTRAGFHELIELVKAPVECLDLSEVAPASRAKLGNASALELYEVLSKIVLPAWDQIPGSDDAKFLESEAGKHWTIPRTEISLVRGTDGQYRFSPATVARSKEFLDRVDGMPYTRTVPLPGMASLPAEGGGWFIPLSTIRQMPAWLRAPIAGQAVWKWLALSMLLSITLLLVRFAFLISRRGSNHPFLQAVRRFALPAFLLAITPVVAYMVLVQINFVGEVGSAIVLVITVLSHLFAAWLAWRIAPVIAEAIISSPQIPSQSIDAHLIRMFSRLAGVVAAATLLAIGADRLGVPLFGVVAGLGVGGLAIALSAQPTIENLIGGLSLFADQPMKVGDLGKYGDVLGTVEGIGIRSTRIRGNDRTVTIIPNSVLSKSSIVNLAQRDRMLIQTVVGVRYETTPEQLRFILVTLREMLLAHPRIQQDQMRVRFVGFGASSLDIEMYAYVTTREWPEFLGIREDVYLRVMDVIDKAGSSMAFPSQTLYMGRDPGLNTDRTRAAEEAVKQWRAEQQLPDPDFSIEQKNQHRGTIDFPPAGSSVSANPG